MRHSAMLMSVIFPAMSLLSLPVQAWAQTAHSPLFTAPRRIPAPVVHDDPAWHTIDYHAQEHAAPLSPAQAMKAAVRASRLTLLDEVGRLASPIDADKAAAWKQTLRSSHTLTPAQSALLHLHVGEVELGQEEQPALALWHFEQAQPLLRRNDPLYGLARYDAAVALFNEGAYSPARDAFKSLLAARPALHGFDPRACALFSRHAQACAGFHAERAKLGIPEPPRLDPLCGAAALAQALKTHGKPYDKKRVLANMRVTGRGSTLGDVMDGAHRLGLSASIVSSDDKGLIALPKPLIAYVEHDHFVSVTQADKEGITYLCADCGPWPGGRVRLTWAQWHKLEATLYGVFSKPEDDAANALSLLERAQNGQAAGVQIASTRPVLSLALTPRTNALLRTLTKHVRVQCGQNSWNSPRNNVTNIGCGYTPRGLKCYKCQPCATHKACPAPGPGGPVHTVSNKKTNRNHQIAKAALKFDKKKPILIASADISHSGDINKWGAQAGDPVNLATGEEEYTPGPDLVVYNPVGPSVVWSRLYDSLRPSLGDGTQYNDMGQGWSYTYNIGVMYGGGQTFYLMEPNGARISLTAPATPTASNPRVACTVQAGFPILAEWDYNSATGGTNFVLTQADRTRLTIYPFFTMVGHIPTGILFPVQQITDRNGNALTFNYMSANNGYHPLLTSIADKNGRALLTLNRANDGSYNLTSIQDCYGRSVYYHVGTYANQNVSQGYPQSYQELDHVSQAVVTGAAAPADRYVYGYQTVGNGDGSEAVQMLHTITVPSPTGTGTATAAINYENATMGVSSLVDANGNVTRFVQTDLSHTQVCRLDAQGNILYRYTAGYDMNMDATTLTNGSVDANGKNTTVVSSSIYADPNDPYRASQTQDGNGYAANGANGKGTWNYTWDQWGHCLTVTTPRNVTTTYTYSYANFALGELTQMQTGAKQATTYTYYEPTGQVHTVTGPLPGTTGGTQSVTASFTYSTLGNLLTATTPGNGTAASLTTTYNYTQDGSYSQSEALGQPLTITDNLGKTSHLRYDTQGRITSGMDALGNAGSVSYTIAGQVMQTLAPATNQTGTGQATTQNTYLYPGGPLTQTALYDESGTLVRHISPTYGREGESVSATGDVNPTTTAYDGMYRPKTLTDGNNHATQYGYTQAGYASQSQMANGDTYKATSWDADGNVLSSQDGRGTVVNYTYNDVESRLTDIAYPATPALNVHIDYDTYGRAYHVTDSTGSKSVAYDDRNAPTSATVTYLNAAGTGNLPPLSLTYGYNPNGSRSSLNTPAGSFSYGYDGRGLPNSLSNPQGESFGWTYLDNGWLWTQTAANALATTYTYNALGEVTELAHRRQTGNTLLADFGGLHYDAVGNRTSLTSSLPTSPALFSGTTSYGYDSKEQLTQESGTTAGGYNNGFGYDAVGNPTTFKGAAQTFNTANQNTQGGTLGFDGCGNPAGYQGTALTWNANNKLAAVGNILTAGYGANGLRAWKQTSAGRTYFLYDGLVPVCEVDANGNVTAVNTFGATGLLSRHTNGTGGGSVFYGFNPQGSVSVRLDSGGNVLSSHTSDAWGAQVSSGSGYAADPYAGYGGQWGYYKDAETNLHLLGHRYYDASAGRFLNRDPIGYAGGVNLYAYTQSNPVNSIDFDGTQPCDLSQAGGHPSLAQNLDPVIATGNYLGHLWAGLNTVLGGIGGLGGSYTYDPVHEVINVHGGWLPWLMGAGGTPAFTLGDVVLWSPQFPQTNCRDATDIYEHELQHVAQNHLAGPIFLPSYGLGAIYGWVVGDPHDGNPYEREADRGAGGRNKFGNQYVK